MTPSTRCYLAGLLGGFGACDVLVWLFLYGVPTRFSSPGLFVAGLLLMAVGARLRAKITREIAAPKDSL
jgi:hypothetical protein